MIVLQLLFSKFKYHSTCILDLIGISQSGVSCQSCIQSDLTERYLKAARLCVVYLLKSVFTELVGKLCWSVNKPPRRFFEFQFGLVAAVKHGVFGSSCCGE